MTTRIEVLEAGGKFRDKLEELGSASSYSQAERDHFWTLFLYYVFQLRAFELRPRYGDESDYYRNAYFWANHGFVHAQSSSPGNTAIRQEIDRAVALGGEALDLITAEPTSAAQGLRGSLLGRPAAAAAPGPLLDTTAHARIASVRASLAASPNTPEPPGPTPPPKAPAKDPPWFAKLLTMFPAEAVTAYVAGTQYFGGGSILLAIIVLTAMVIVRWAALTSDKKRWPDPWVLGTTIISFLLWVGATSDILLVNEVASLLGGKPCAPETTKCILVGDVHKWAGFLILIWTWVVPAITPAETPAPQTES